MPEADHVRHILKQGVAPNPHQCEDAQRDQRDGHNDDFGG